MLTTNLSTQRTPIGDRLARYFESRYPTRSQGCAKRIVHLGFRRGEASRRTEILRWLRGRNFESIVDVGCGDGAFVCGLFERSVPVRVRVEDLVRSNVDAASFQWRQRGAGVDAVVGDSFESESESAERFDVVFCCGVLDYRPDWQAHATRLLERSRGALIVDMPRSGTLHSWVRSLWLRLNGLSLYSVKRSEIGAFERSLAARVEVAETRLHWLLCITPKGRR